LFFAVDIQPNVEKLSQMNDLILKIKKWDDFTDTAIRNQLAPLVFTKFKHLANSNLIPNVNLNKLKQAWFKTFARSAVLIEHYKTVAEAFNKDGIPVIALKGVYLSDKLYKEVGLRQFSDIDLLVEEAHGTKCMEILTKLGYQDSNMQFSDFVSENSEIIHFLPKIKQGVSIEIHVKLHLSNEKYHLDMEEIWRDSIIERVHGVIVRTFSKHLLLLYLCLHLDKHFASGKFQYTGFFDIANILFEHADSFKWNDFTNYCSKSNAQNSTYKYILLVNKYFGAPIPKYIKSEYGYLLKNKDERKFLKGFSEMRTQTYSAPEVFANLKRIKGYIGKWRYIVGMLFPSKTFMIGRYNITKRKSLIIFYIQRFSNGIKSFIRFSFDLFK